MNVAIIGTGYVGLTTGVCLAYLGHNVYCVDTNKERVRSLSQGQTPIFEPFLEKMLADAKNNLCFCTDPASAVPKADVVFIAVGTPTGANGQADLSYVQSAAQAIGQNLGNHFTVIVNKSTVPIGSGNWVESLVHDAYEKRNGSKPPQGSFAVASNPEFLREGAALSDTLYADRVVIGSDDARSSQLLYNLYRPILEQSFQPPAYLPRPNSTHAVPLISTDLPSAELIKYAANAFLALKISYINEIGNLAESVGADTSAIAKGIGLDDRIGPRFLQSGIGWGGSCFGKDTAALVSTASEYGLEMPIVRAAREVNQNQRERVIEKLLAEIRILKGRTIGLLGLAFKPNTDDLRDSPAIDIAQKLIDRGARVKVHDPVASDRFRAEYSALNVICCDTPEDVFQDADAVVLVTEWPEYRELLWDTLAATMRSPFVLDGRNILDPARLKKGGFRFAALG
jgi:UDPglucose 6-dehydrogenase